MKIKLQSWQIVAGLILIGVLGFVLFKGKAPTETKQSAVQTFSALEVHTRCEAKPYDVDKFACYEDFFNTDERANGAKHTLEALDEIQKLGGYAEINCHPLTHKLGNIALHVYGSVLAASPQFLPVCYSGYYHGLLEEYLSTTSDYESALKSACGTLDDKVYFDWFQCTHGLGHGIMQYQEDDVLKSVKDCDVIDPAHAAQEICYAGAFMENITTDAKTGHASKFIKADNPIYPCDIVEVKYKSACYFLSSSMILRINGWNFKDGFKSCDTKAEEDYRWLCWQSMGRDVSGSSLRNPSKVVDLCLLASEQARGDCFFGAVRDFINEKGLFDTAIGLCVSVPETYKANCYNGIILDLGIYRKGQDYLKVCAQMPAIHRSKCEQAVKY